MTAPRQRGLLRIGMVGGGRTRNGLGPFLARFAERAGGRVIGVVGRNLERAALAAEDLGSRLGHEVTPWRVLDSLSRVDGGALDAVIIASPVETHLAALQAALKADLHVLCEKPLVSVSELQTVPELLSGFAQRDRVLVENCQVPYLLPVLHQLFPELEAHGLPVRELAMGLSPTGVGRAMVEDTLSHFLSLLQALLAGQAVTGVDRVEYSSRQLRAEELTLTMRFAAGEATVEGSLHLVHTPSQPRPAWLAVNGCRMDRRIQLPDYRQLYCAGDREITVADPLELLVYRFIRLIREPDVERIRETSRTIGERARLYGEVLSRW